MATRNLADSPLVKKVAMKTRAEEPPRFTFPVSRSFTGKIQFTASGPDVGSTEHGDALRGQVFAIENEELAARLVESGQFAHVVASAPVGQPEEFRPAPKEQPAAPPIPPPQPPPPPPPAPPITEE